MLSTTRVNYWPLLFLIYINDITNSSNLFHFKLFAENTNLFHSFQKTSVEMDLLNLELSKVCTWCKANKLTINIDKTNFMIFKTAQRKITLEGALHIDDLPIDLVSSAVYLGVTLDSSLSWRPNINTIIKKISKTIGLISYLCHYLPKSIMILLYNSLILPHITYCIEIWGNTFSTFIDPVFELQKKLSD